MQNHFRKFKRHVLVCAVIILFFMIIYTGIVEKVLHNKAHTPLADEYGNVLPTVTPIGSEFAVDFIRNAEIAAKETVRLHSSASDKVTFNRPLPDSRPKECRQITLPRKLGRASIIIVFCDELQTVLMRTLHSIWERTPLQLIYEVILVHDNSTTKEFTTLKNSLKPFMPKLRLISNNKLLGYHKSRNIAMKMAKGDILVFLTAHCEVNVNWLPPMLAQIKLDKRTVAVPQQDTIEYTTLEYIPSKATFIGLFDWSLEYRPSKKTRPIPKLKKNAMPTFDGIYFAIKRKYFLELGGFDIAIPQMVQHTIHLSFKFWQCGANILLSPCSRIGHIQMPTVNSEDEEYRQKQDYFVFILQKWVGKSKYLEYFHRNLPVSKLLMDENRVAFPLNSEDQLKCKSFDWYMLNVAAEVAQSTLVPAPIQQFGYLQNVGRNKCMLSAKEMYGHLVRAKECGTLDPNVVFILTSAGRLIVNGKCLDASKVRLLGSPVVGTFSCDERHVNGPWMMKNKYLVYIPLNKCLGFDPLYNRALLQPCIDEDLYLKWQFLKVLV